MNGPFILGINASHNGAACLLNGDRIVVAIQEERLTREKRAPVYGATANLCIEYCLQASKLKPVDLDMVVISAQGHALSASHDLRLNSQLSVESHRTPWNFISHHMAHAVSAFALAGFDEAAVLVVDGSGSPFGDLSPEEQSVVIGHDETGWESISVYDGQGAALRALEKHVIPDGRWLIEGGGMARFRSLGAMYSAVADQIFGDPMEAGQVMGLAPFGRPCIPVDEFYSFADGQFQFHDCVPARFRHQHRWPAYDAQYKDLAASVQAALEQAVLLLGSRACMLSGSSNLCYAGGVALNCVANECLHQKFPGHLFVPPAAEDSGVAIGAAYWGLWRLTGRNSHLRYDHDALGRSYVGTSIREAASQAPVVVRSRSRGGIDECARRLANGQFCGWFQSGSEFGPRALGHRSILADPRCQMAKDLLNARIKFRADFRPFAPAVLAEQADTWFYTAQGQDCSPFMLRTWRFRPERRWRVPAVVHVDGTGRVQTVTPESNQRFYALLREFYKLSGVPILLNTSFNTHREPIVETPEDAIWCMLSAGLDFCVLEDQIIEKHDGFNCLLDLYPVASGLAADGTLASGTTQREGHFKIRARTELGSYTVELPGWVRTLLSLANGTRSGWQVLGAWQRQVDNDAEASWLTSWLAYLRSRRVIRLSKGGGAAHDY